jgi:hypothetical protein
MHPSENRKMKGRQRGVPSEIRSDVLTKTGVPVMQTAPELKH